MRESLLPTPYLFTPILYVMILLSSHLLLYMLMSPTQLLSSAVPLDLFQLFLYKANMDRMGGEAGKLRHLHICSFFLLPLAPREGTVKPWILSVVEHGYWKERFHLPNELIPSLPGCQNLTSKSDLRLSITLWHGLEYMCSRVRGSCIAEGVTGQHSSRGHNAAPATRL